MSVSQWFEDLKQHILGINKAEYQKRRVYGENNKIQNKTLKKTYFTRPKILSDWEYNKNKQNEKTKDIHVKQFSQHIEYDKPWNKLKYEHKINRVIHYVKLNNLNTDIKKLLIKMTKSRKLQVQYENGEIQNIINLEEL